MIGGKNNVLKTIEQKLVYVGNEYGKRVEIQNMISVLSKIINIFLILYYREENFTLQFSYLCNQRKGQQIYMMK